MGALFHREQHRRGHHRRRVAAGHRHVVDGRRRWRCRSSSASPGRRRPSGTSMRQPARRAPTRTKDDRHISLCCLQAGKYWAELVARFGRPELATDERFADRGRHQGATVADAVDDRSPGRSPSGRSPSGASAARAASPASGRWCRRPSRSPRTRRRVANGYVRRVRDRRPARRSSSSPRPIQFDERAAPPSRAPEFNEHGDEILESLGLDWDTIIDLKVKGVVA